jgi:hypothetical protein
MNEVALVHAEAGSSPSGTGSFNYFSNFAAVVENLAFSKQVSIFGHDLSSGVWQSFPCSYSQSLPGNLEIWVAHVNAPRIDQFVIEYQVSGNVYWDNNSGNNYLLDVQAAESTDGVGTAVLKPNVFAVEFETDASGNLNVDILVKNIAFAKQVAIVYTTNDWQSFQNAGGAFQQGFPPVTTSGQINAELWKVEALVGAGQHGQFAASYSVGGSTYWDNNFGRNYSF